jgi:hypothetical protein
MVRLLLAVEEMRKDLYLIVNFIEFVEEVAVLLLGLSTHDGLLYVFWQTSELRFKLSSLLLFLLFP